MGNGEWEATASVLIEHGADLTKALPNIIDHKNATDYADLVNQMIRKSSQEARNAALITAIRNMDAQITTSLLQHGADASSPAPHHPRFTPLAQAQVTYTHESWRYPNDQIKQERMLSIFGTLLKKKADALKVRRRFCGIFL